MTKNTVITGIQKNLIDNAGTCWSASTARSFFLNPHTYCDAVLPGYIDFQPVLEHTSRHLTGKSLRSFLTKEKTSDRRDLNHIIPFNRSGDFEIRPYSLVHPAIHVACAHELTSDNGWAYIMDLLDLFAEDRRFECVSFPIKAARGLSSAQKGTDCWHEEMELKSVSLSTDYEYMYWTDVENCSGSMQSGAWKLAMRSLNKAGSGSRAGEWLEFAIADFLNLMSNGGKIGIPQGNGMMNFIAELVLGYVDHRVSRALSSAIANSCHFDFQVLRFRDDYRIFVNDPEIGELISRFYSAEFSALGMKFGARKTGSSRDIIMHSLKADRIDTLCQSISHSNEYDLMGILALSQRFPNSGGVVNSLIDYLARHEEITDIRGRKEINVAILAEIMRCNPRTYPVGAAIMSRMLGSKDDCDSFRIFTKFLKKFKSIPNSGHLELWLQRVCLGRNWGITYDEPLCKVVAGELTTIWKCDWLKNGIKKRIHRHSVVNTDVLRNSPTQIAVEEIIPFPDHIDY